MSKNEVRYTEEHSLDFELSFCDKQSVNSSQLFFSCVALSLTAEDRATQWHFTDNNGHQCEQCQVVTHA